MSFIVSGFSHPLYVTQLYGTYRYSIGIWSKTISTNPSEVDVTVKHNPNNIGTTGGNIPGTTEIQPIVPNNNETSPHSQQHSPIIPNQPTVK